MGKIAAVILPIGRQSQLGNAWEKVGDMLCQAHFHRVESQIYTGSKAVCGLMRIGVDAINPATQPLDCGSHKLVSCGYYFSGSQGENRTSSKAWGNRNRDSATHLVHDLAASGEQQLSHGDGVYAFAWWDGANERLIAGVDKVGMRPLFWTAIEGGGYAVASEIKALLPFVNDPTINWAAWEEYMAFGYLFSDHTPFTQISRLGASEIIKCGPYKHSTVIVEEFLQNISVVERPSQHFLQEQHEVFGQAMQRHMELIPGQCGLMQTLSGGFDTRRISGWLMSNNASFEAYTVPDFQPDGSEHESSIVREFCSRSGIPLQRVYPSDVDGRRLVTAVRDFATDFQSDEHNYATMLAMALDCRNKVNFDGLVGGMIMTCPFLKPAYFKDGGERAFVADWPILNTDKMLRMPDTDPPLHIRIRDELRKWGNHPNRFTYFYMMSRTRREVALAPLMIQVNSMESLCPYLDRDFMVNGLSFPPWKKLQTSLQRPLIQAYDRKLLDVPTTHDAGVGKDPQYTKVTSDIERQAKHRLLRGVTKNTGQRYAWKPDTKQKWRFFAASYFHHFLPQDFVKWELNKAERISGIIGFSNAARSREQYLSDSSLLKNKFSSRPDWLKCLIE